MSVQNQFQIGLEQVLNQFGTGVYVGKTKRFRSVFGHVRKTELFDNRTNVRNPNIRISEDFRYLLYKFGFQAVLIPMAIYRRFGF